MKSLDGLMAFLARRLSPEQYSALARYAASQGLGLRDYVGRRVLKMVQERITRSERVSVSAAGVIIVAPEKGAVLR